jgi:hypothetical protein
MFQKEGFYSHWIKSQLNLIKGAGFNQIICNGY